MNLPTLPLKLLGEEINFEGQPTGIFMLCGSHGEAQFYSSSAGDCDLSGAGIPPQTQHPPSNTGKFCRLWCFRKVLLAGTLPWSYLEMDAQSYDKAYFSILMQRWGKNQNVHLCITCTIITNAIVLTKLLFFHSKCCQNCLA